MENATYATLTRQTGLMSEMRVIANNIANASTTGFRAESLIFSEYVSPLGPDHESISMATGRVRHTNQTQGALTQTGGTFDLAIEGDAFFLIDTAEGPRLTRSGSFTPNADGNLVTMDGNPVLDAGGAPVFVPQGLGAVGIAPDGTISVGGDPVGQIGLVVPNEPTEMTRQSSNLFDAVSGYEAAPEGRMVQGYLEGSNVNSLAEISRMIAVQRAYELGQTFLDNENERILKVIQTVSR